MLGSGLLISGNYVQSETKPGHLQLTWHSFTREISRTTSCNRRKTVHLGKVNSSKESLFLDTTHPVTMNVAVRKQISKIFFL